MALSPLQIELIDSTGGPVSGATIELRHELTAVTADGYNRDGTVMTQPFTTDANGAMLTWIVNGIYEWRATGIWSTDWKAFRAWGGFGVEGLFSSTPSASLNDPMPASFTTLDTITVPSFGIEESVGEVEVVIDFAFDHMFDLALILLAPNGTTQAYLWQGDSLPSWPVSTDDYAFDGEITLIPGPGESRYFDSSNNPRPMVDGGTYHAGDLSAVDGQLHNQVAAGNWALQWKKTGDAFTPRSGIVRSWSLEFLPT